MEKIFLVLSSLFVILSCASKEEINKKNVEWVIENRAEFDLDCPKSKLKGTTKGEPHFGGGPMYVIISGCDKQGLYITSDGGWKLDNLKSKPIKQ